MKSIYDSRQRLKFVFIFTAILIAIASLVVSDMLIKDLAQEERQKMEVWAEATRLTASKNTAVDLSLVLKILEGNTTIPVVLCNDKDSIMFVKNISFPENDVEEFKKAKVKELKSKNTIVIDMEDGTFQYVYYDDSVILKRLLIYPYAQLTVVFVFIVIAFLALASTKKAEQNKVWVGLSKETAHQLGTPISSLMAWTELLKSAYPSDNLIPCMTEDVARLQMIANRFSKIGSAPEMEQVDLGKLLKEVTEYMARRTSNKVEIITHLPENAIIIPLNASLFGWVIENLCKNAIDAMDGVGKITVSVIESATRWYIDVEDTGKGIIKSKHQTIFTPGYTTKKRGWGLGLSLARRIVEEYHSGRIFVKQSELNKGTVFRIELKK